MAEPNERPADTRWPDKPVPGASGRHGEPHEDVQGAVSGDQRLEGASRPQRDAPESEVRPNTTGEGSETAEWGAEAAGGSVIDKRPPENKRRAEQKGDADAIGDRLRDASDVED